MLERRDEFGRLGIGVDKYLQLNRWQCALFAGRKARRQIQRWWETHEATGRDDAPDRTRISPLVKSRGA